MVHYLDDDVVRRLLGDVDMRSAFADTLRRVRTGEIETAPRVGLGGGPLGQITHLMMARDHPRQRVVTKLVDYDPTRPERLARPSNVGLVTYMVGADVAFTASAASFTAIRTAACTAFAVDLLAQPEAQVLGVLGAGPQAHEHIRQVSRVRPVSEVRLASRSQQRAESLLERLRAEGTPLRVTLCNSIAAACDGADIVVAATSSVLPVLFAEHVHAGLCLALIGSGIPARREASGEVMAGAARIVVETQEAAWHEAGDLLIAEAEGYLDRTCTTDLASVLDAPTPPPRDGYTIYKSVGAAWQDLACAAALDAIVSDERGVEYGRLAVHPPAAS